MGTILARLYDPVTFPLERAFLAEVRRRTFSGLTGRVLDLGTGTGLSLAHLGGAETLVALDPGPHLLERAVAKHPEVRFVRGDGMALPFADGTFDGVAVGLVLCTVPSLEGTLAEVRRVLRSRGRMAFVEHVRLGGAAARFQELVAPLWHRVSGGCRLDRDTPTAVRRAGFRIVHLEEHLGGLVVAGSALVEGGATGTMADER